MKSIKGRALLCIALFFLLLYSACVEPVQTHTALPPGIWRAELNVEISQDIIAGELKEQSDVALRDVKRGRLPFNFEVIYENEEDFYIEIINGEERIPVRDIYFGKDLKTLMDTIRVDFPIYDSYISALYRENVIEGEWVVNYRPQYRIPFLAYHGQDHRFSTVSKETNVNISGKWNVEFSPGTEEAYPAIGEFRQNGSNVQSTFMTETGDYRFLEGLVLDNKVYLSCFDGAHAFLFEARVLADSSLIGTFQSGKHYQTNWTAVRDDEASITDPFELTYLNPDIKDFTFTLPNIDGGTISLDDEKYKGKVKLVKIMGTWCPNCLDEARFLKEFTTKSPFSDIEIIAVGFEKYKDEQRAIQSLKRFKERLDLDWDIAYGGSSDKAKASAVFPMLNKISSYPTLIVLDKNNQIRKIHTGFNGPATSEYQKFSSDFQQLMKDLRSE